MPSFITRLIAVAAVTAAALLLVAAMSLAQNVGAIVSFVGAQIHRRP